MEKRVQIAEIMTVILLVAVDSRALRSIFLAEGGPTDALLSTAGTLVLNVLGVGVLLLRRRLRRGKSTSFLMVFEMVGGFCLLSYSLAAVLFPNLVMNHFKYVWSSYIAYVASLSIGGGRHLVILIEMALMIYFATILLLPAAIAGLYAQCRKRVAF